MCVMCGVAQGQYDLRPGETGAVTISGSSLRSHTTHAFSDPTTVNQQFSTAYIPAPHLSLSSPSQSSPGGNTLSDPAAERSEGCVTASFWGDTQATFIDNYTNNPVSCTSTSTGSGFLSASALGASVSVAPAEDTDTIPPALPLPLPPSLAPADPVETGTNEALPPPLPIELEGSPRPPPVADSESADDEAPEHGHRSCRTRAPLLPIQVST